jgi:integrase
VTKLPDYHPETDIRIEPPCGKGKSFRIRYKSPDTNDKWTILRLPEIDAANKLLKDGTVSKEHTHKKLKVILAAQYAHRDRKKKKAPFMSKNLELVEKMWEEKYNRRRRRNMKRPNDSKYQLQKAAEACGLHPIDTCDLDQLADYLDSTLGDNQNRLQRRITWINSILQWLGRNKLQNVDRTRSKVKYLNEDEFKRMYVYIRDKTTRTLARIAFYTGARLGEIFFIQPRHLKDNVLFLELQMTDEKLPDGTYKEDTLKSGYSRDIFLYDGVRKDLEEWAAVPFAERYKIREKSFCKRITRACKKAFGEADPIKLLTFHDLRHCHAIWLLQAEATITEVAQQLGNGLDVCYRFYSGFELKKESVERLKVKVPTPAAENPIAESDSSFFQSC